MLRGEQPHDQLRERLAPVGGVRPHVVDRCQPRRAATDRTHRRGVPRPACARAAPPRAPAGAGRPANRRRPRPGRWRCGPSGRARAPWRSSRSRSRGSAALPSLAKPRDGVSPVPGHPGSRAGARRRRGRCSSAPSRKSPSGSSRVAVRETSSTRASRASSGGTPSAAGEALQRLPGERRRVLDLHRADLPRGRPQGIEGARQFGPRAMPTR